MEWIKAFHLEKYNLWEKKINFFFSNFQCFFFLPHSFFWAYLGIIFVPRHQLKIIIFPWSKSVFPSSKKVSKNHDKNSARRYLPKIPFVSWTENGPLGVNLMLEYGFFGIPTIMTRRPKKYQFPKLEICFRIHGSHP